jgi:hypothetical protein
MPGLIWIVLYILVTLPPLLVMFVFLRQEAFLDFAKYVANSSLFKTLSSVGMDSDEDILEDCDDGAGGGSKECVKRCAKRTKRIAKRKAK